MLPDEAQPLQRSQLLTALSAGAAIIQLRRVAHQLDLSVALDDALGGALAKGRGAIAMAQLASLDRVLAAHADLPPAALRARSVILALSEALTQHPSYFGAATPG